MLSETQYKGVLLKLSQKQLLEIENILYNLLGSTNRENSLVT